MNTMNAMMKLALKIRLVKLIRHLLVIDNLQAISGQSRYFLQSTDVKFHWKYFEWIAEVSMK